MYIYGVHSRRACISKKILDGSGKVYTLTVRKRDSSCAFIESKRAAWKTPRPDLVTVHGSCDLESEIIRISRARQSVVTECLSYTP